MAAPLLTRSQFHKTDVAKRPGASYGGYVRYVTRARATRAAGGGGGGGGSLEGLAQNDVNTQINAALAGYQATTRAAQQQANRQAARGEGFAKALAQLTASTPAEEKAIYTDAAHGLNAYGTGLTGRTADLWNSEAAQAQANVANLTGGAGHVGGYDIPGLQNVSHFTGVTIPGVTLEEEGRNAMVSAQNRRAADVASIGQIAQGYRAKTTDLQNTLAGQRTALEAQRPMLYSKALQARQAYAAQQAAVAAQQAAALQSQRNFMLDYNEKVREFGLEQKRLKNSAVKTASAAVPHTIGSASGGYFQYNEKTGQWIPIPGTKTATPASAKLTTSDIATIGNTVFNAFYGHKNPNYDARFDPHSPLYDSKVVATDPTHATARAHRYSTPPGDVNKVMHYLRTVYPTAYPEIYSAILRYARIPGSRWAAALNWQGPAHGGTRKRNTGMYKGRYAIPTAIPGHK